VTGKQGNFLRSIEEEFKVLMFFADYGGDRKNDYEKLIIFGGKRDRRGAELKVLSAVETKCPGHFAQFENEIMNRDLNDEDSGWKTEVLEFKEDELSFALGKNGGTRRKLERASGCLVQYIGHLALFSGWTEQRSKVKEYLKFLFDQLEGPVDVPDAAKRGDCTVLEIPQDCVGYITGNKRAALSSIEQDFG